MYKILVDKSSASTIEDEVKQAEGTEEPGEVYTSEYFESMPLLEWNSLEPTGNVYTPRTGHEVISHKEKIYLFGGTDDDQRKNDLYGYCVYKNRWELLPAQGEIPSRRSGSRGISFKNSLYFFGGYFKKSDEYYSDLYQYNLDRQSWKVLPSQGNCPPPRIDHSANRHSDKLYIFGGFDGNLRYADFYCYDLKNHFWTKVVG